MRVLIRLAALAAPLLLVAIASQARADHLEIRSPNVEYGELEFEHFGQTTFDAFVRYTRKLNRRVTWTGALHVRNIGVSNELRPLAVWPDGRVVQWTIKEPQRWTLTNTFRF